MAKSIRQQYTVERADLTQDREEILRLWSYLPKPYPDEKKLQWFYGDNPAGKSMVYVLQYTPEDRIVGVILAAPRKFLIESQEYTGAVLGDFVVEPKHRSLGPGLLLQNSAVELALTDFDLQFGFPNPASEKLRRFAGFAIDHKLSELVLPLDYAHYLTRILPSTLARLVAVPLQAAYSLVSRLRRTWLRRQFKPTKVDDAFTDSLWRSVDKSSLNRGLRDSAFVNWRLRRDPFVAYDFLGVSRQNGSPAAYLAYCRKEQALVFDVLAADSLALEALIAELICIEQARNSRSIAATICDQDIVTIQTMKMRGFRERGAKQAYVDLNSSLAEKFGSIRLCLGVVDNDI